MSHRKIQVRFGDAIGHRSAHGFRRHCYGVGGGGGIGSELYGTYIAEEKVNRADHASFFHEGRIKEGQLRKGW